MVVKLIPVIEIRYYNEGISSPRKSPYWVYPDEYNDYHNAVYSQAGFKDGFVFYLPGSEFINLNDISISNLTKLVEDNIDDFINGKYARAEASQMAGGYVLNVDGVDVFFPQCCADLADIAFWENIANNNQSLFSAGHPEPVLTIDRDTVTFDFATDEFDEPFAPPPAYETVTIQKADLRIAVDRVKAELIAFAEKIKAINVTSGINIPDVEKLLIWGNE